MTTIDTRPRAGSSPLALFHCIDSVLGLRPRRSLVLHIRRRRKPFAVLRLDLPHPPGVCTAATWRLEHQRFAHVLTGLVARVNQVAAVTIVLYGDDWGIPEQRLMAVVSGSLAAAGFSVEASFCVAGDRWAAVHGPGSSRPVWQGLPPCPQQPAAEHTGACDPHRGAFRRIDPIDPERRRRALATVEASTGGGNDAPTGADAVAALLDWRAALADRAALPADARAIALVWALRNARVRDGVLVQCAWGFEAAVLALQHPGEPHVLRGARESAAEPHPVGPYSPRPHQAGPGYASVLGDGAEPPPAALVRRAVEVLRHVVACAPEPITAPPLAILAWLEWCRGRGSVSAAYLQACLAVDPDYQLALLFRPLLETGHVPEWIGR